MNENVQKEISSCYKQNKVFTLMFVANVSLPPSLPSLISSKFVVSSSPQSSGTTGATAKEI